MGVFSRAYATSWMKGLGTRLRIGTQTFMSTRKFYYAGMLVAVSLANGGPGLTCLPETVYTYICHGLQSKFTPELSMITDLDIQKSLEQVSLRDQCRVRDTCRCNVYLYLTA